MGIFLKDMNLKGKTALITGASKGLGRGAAIAIAEAGGNVIAIGRNQLELNTLKKESFSISFFGIFSLIILHELNSRGVLKRINIIGIIKRRIKRSS